MTQFAVWAAAATYDSNSIKMRQLLYGKLEEGAKDSAPLTQLAVSHPVPLALQEVGCAADCSPRMSLPACCGAELRPPGMWLPACWKLYIGSFNSPRSLTQPLCCPATSEALTQWGGVPLNACSPHPGSHMPHHFSHAASFNRYRRAGWQGRCQQPMAVSLKTCLMHGHIVCGLPQESPQHQQSCTPKEAVPLSLRVAFCRPTCISPRSSEP